MAPPSGRLPPASRSKSARWPAISASGPLARLSSASIRLLGNSLFQFLQFELIEALAQRGEQKLADDSRAGGHRMDEVGTHQARFRSVPAPHGARASHRLDRKS